MTRGRKLRAAAAALVCGVLLGACGSDLSPPGSSSAGPSVVTALYPLAFVAERVGGEDIVVTNLAAPGVEPHDLELAPRQVGAIAAADLIVYLDGFAPAVDEAVDQNAADRALDVAALVTLMAPTEDGEGGDGPGFDPHFWLDPMLLGQVATALADRLSEIDPSHADAYAERAAMLVGDLTGLGRDLEAGLTNCHTRTIVTAHAAFAYLAERYGLEQLSVAGIDPDAEPSAARIAEVQKVIVAKDVTTVYFEPLTSPDVVDAIAADLHVDTAELDPIESVSPGEDYLTVMADNLASLRAGQGCS